MVENKKSKSLKLKKISTSGLIMDEATRRRKEARKALIELSKKKQTGNIINQFNADRHADAVVKNRLKMEAEKAKQQGAMNESELVAYYDELRKKFERLTDQIGKKESLNQKELQVVKTQVKKESCLALKNIADHNNLTPKEVKEYLGEISENTEQLGDIKAETSDSQKVLEGIKKIEEVVQDAEVQSNFVADNKRELQITLARDIIPLTLKGKTIKVTVNDFFILPLGSNGEDYQAFSQHFQYLEKLLSDGCFSQQDYDEIKKISDQIPREKYKKFFDIFKRGKFRITTLQAVHETWSTGKLFSLKVD